MEIWRGPYPLHGVWEALSVFQVSKPVLSPVAASPPCPVRLYGTSSISVLIPFYLKISSKEEEKKKLKNAGILNW